MGNAFNINRPTLALFSKCASIDELHVVRDAFFLGMASRLCPREYESLRISLITDPTSFTSIANSLGTVHALDAMVIAARVSEGWEGLLGALHSVAALVKSDLNDVWSTLENGRVEWLGALNSAHSLKVMLKDALQQDETTTDRDLTEAKMVYLYALSLSLPSIEERTKERWRKAVSMEEKYNPLKGYDGDQWDSKRGEWRPLDAGVQEAADAGGSSFKEAWEA